MFLQGNEGGWRIWERCKDCGKHRGDKDRGQGVRKVEFRKKRSRNG